MDNIQELPQSLLRNIDPFVTKIIIMPYIPSKDDTDLSSLKTSEELIQVAESKKGQLVHYDQDKDLVYTIDANN
jgi:hypothetical protein